MEISFYAIIEGIITAVVIGIFMWFVGRIKRNMYSFLLGEWHGYYLIKEEKHLLEQKIRIAYSGFGQLSIKVEEKSSANYGYEGKLWLMEDTLYGKLKGIQHPAYSFLVIKLPFNRRGMVPSLNGVFCGLTQDKNPAAVKVHWCRTNKETGQVKKELGAGEKKYVIVKKDTSENELRKSIST